ncbi:MULTISPECIES: S41 family peptidase [unclassified Streptomyces]|uniref:S41 family peptidase n=1 Tax=unclassified Streptomyces TaxID=2593676 RepID=UPI0022B6901A|nr:MULTISPECIES: S41 family peptidase [unclassified Streptomyces]MCZ7414554.1 S41 family peptidase [Streptomyces sp. WMMC897]MCZ7431481.1 S41 family peptidase [Streptomyces sp. WMMC1477]
MSGSWMFVQPRRIGRGAALPLVFAGVLLTGFATGSWTTDGPPHDDARGPGGMPPGAVAEPERSGANDAQDAVSRSGDRWSAAYTAREYEGVREALDGRYVGVGIAVRGGDGAPVEVARVTEGSPAARAGIRPGDRLRTVDGRDVTGLPVTEVVARLRGDALAVPEGSRVELGLGRAGREWDATLERAGLETEAVTVERLRHGITRLKVAAFTTGSGEALTAAVAALPPGEGVVLDLRGNSGGLLLEATEAASAFLDGGLVATWGEGEGQHALYAEPGGDTESPLVVLVDGGSMSAAELLAGALQDRGRALVVGSRTFGKGAVQVPYEQPDGSVAELTVGEYATPGGRTLEGVGLQPDVAVEGGESAQDKAVTVLSGLAARA